MKYKLYLIILMAFGLHCLDTYAQNTFQFNIEDKAIKRISFEADEVALIKIKTHKQSSIKFTSASESTYKKELFFNYRVEGNTLKINSIYPERLAYGDNKMTSMQEFSVSVEMLVPEYLIVDINSDIASIEGRGIFKNLIINTKSGHCNFNRIIGNASINSYDGDISINTKEAIINAMSQQGKVIIENSWARNYHIDLRTVKGDIKVIQTE